MKIDKITLSIMVTVAFLSQKSHAYIVHDPLNWIQNSMTAANTAKQLVNEAKQIQIALQDIKNYEGNVGQWANIQNLLQRLGAETQKGQALAYSMSDLDNQFKQTYPGYVSSQNYQQDYSKWSQTSMDTMRATLDSAGLQAEQFKSEQSSMNQIAQLSRTAQGRMQALQVGNMLSMQEVAQIQKLRQLVIAQTNAQNTYASYQIQKDQSVEASSSAWLTSSAKSFPRYGANI
jgi:P-type conjugative transfer protein TrbJ